MTLRLYLSVCEDIALATCAEFGLAAAKKNATIGHISEEPLLKEMLENLSTIH